MCNFDDVKLTAKVHAGIEKKNAKGFAGMPGIPEPARE